MTRMMGDFMSPPRVTMTFSGVRSPCTMDARWQCTSARSTWSATFKSGTDGSGAFTMAVLMGLPSSQPISSSGTSSTTAHAFTGSTVGTSSFMSDSASATKASLAAPVANSSGSVHRIRRSPLRSASRYETASPPHSRVRWMM
jgi:hypothetical protein